MNKRTLIIAAVLFLALAAYLLIFLIPDFLRTMNGPQAVTMADAANVATETDTYVAISNGAWDCDTIHLVRGLSSSTPRRMITRYTEAFRTNDSKTILLLARMSDEMDCAQLQAASLTGYLKRMSAEHQQELINEVRLARYIKAEQFLELCGHCGPSNSLIGTFFGLGFALLGIVLLITGLRMKG